jgi:hypothetical protein
VQTAEQQELIKSDLRKRSVIEGIIRTSKRKHGLDRILTKLGETSRTVITMALSAMNAEKILSLLRLLLSILFDRMYLDALFARFPSPQSAFFGCLASF